MNHKSQRGFGLMEVLVALVLLAIGVLGFALLQVRAIDASIEASKRIQAMNLARDIAERLRANQQGLTKEYEENVTNDDGTTKKETYKAYIKAFKGKENLSSYTYSSCFGTATACTSENFAQQDANQVLYKAYQMGMKVGLDTCSGLEKPRYCIYIAWDETQPKEGSDDNDCVENGSYKDSSKCIMMEAY
jgi:type IV pilus assembly protein PilV